MGSMRNVTSSRVMDVPIQYFCVPMKSRSYAGLDDSKNF